MLSTLYKNRTFAVLSFVLRKKGGRRRRHRRRAKNTNERTMRFCAPLCLLCLFAVVVTTHHFFGFEEDFFFGVAAAADAVFDGETVEVPTVKKSSSAYDSYEKKSAKCEDCVSFLREMSDRVRSKRFRERAYKVVDEMCERVFDPTKDREKTTECEAMGKTYAKKAMEYAKTLSEEDKGKAACKKMHLCTKKKTTRRRRFWSSSSTIIGTMEDAARRAARRARERVASGTFFASWFSSSSSSSPRKTEKEETQRSVSSSTPSSSMCAFCEYGASKLATAMNDPDFAESAKREFIAACVASETFSDEQCKNAADEYEAKFYDALQTWLDDGEACEDLLGC